MNAIIKFERLMPTFLFYIVYILYIPDSSLRLNFLCVVRVRMYILQSILLFLINF